MTIKYRRVVEGCFICCHGVSPGVYKVRFGDEFGGWAYFYLNGKKVWNCNAAFALAQTLEAKDPKDPKKKARK